MSESSTTSARGASTGAPSAQRPDRVSSALLLGLILVLNLDGLLPVETLGRFLTGTFLLLVLLLRRTSLLPVGTLFFFTSLVRLAAGTPLARLPVLPLLVPLLLSTAAAAAWTGLGPALVWMKRGSLNRSTLWIIPATAAGSTVALLVWATWTDTLGASAGMADAFAAYPAWLLLGLAVPAFALLNAFVEEAVYRGVLQHALSLHLRHVPLVLVLQASAFAALHFRVGFPNGVAGYVMVFVYGAVLGFLRERTGGLLAPWVTHVLADLTIGAYVLLAIPR